MIFFSYLELEYSYCSVLLLGVYLKRNVTGILSGIGIFQSNIFIIVINYKFIISFGEGPSDLWLTKCQNKEATDSSNSKVN